MPKKVSLADAPAEWEKYMISSHDTEHSYEYYLRSSPDLDHVSLEPHDFIEWDEEDSDEEDATALDIFVGLPHYVLAIVLATKSAFPSSLTSTTV
ncbi:hypothetical protein N7495_008730 [Penicillium taxi]|uniref:uncharacterized protein n=1 Tax=Penicillium taxi TaxID=168475 RepID=UPI00254549C0|nr:uncharacterized protein N7495_008730 [Penicillium taxi]KAJ5888689.1 hypothetical protein N7495_008730 [Penicillium taxi]